VGIARQPPSRAAGWNWRRTDGRERAKGNFRRWIPVPMADMLQWRVPTCAGTCDGGSERLSPRAL
jgi:hypothetical protein